MKAGKKSNAEAQRGGEAERTDRWPLVRLGDVCEVIAGQSPEGTNYTEDSSFTEFHQGAKAFGEKVLKPSGVFTKEETKIAPQGAILLSVRAPVGTLNLTDRRICIGRGLAALLPHEGLDRNFLFLYLLSAKASLEAVAGAGSVFASLSCKVLSSLEVPLPPISVQRAIVERLDSALARAGALEKRFAAIAKNAELSFKAALNEEFAGRTSGTSETSGTGGSSDSRRSSTSKDPSAPSKPWPLVRLGDVGRVAMCKRILKSQTTAEGDIPFFKIGTFGKKPDAFISRETFEEYSAKYSYPRKGDVLISAAGTIGRAVVFDGKPAYFQDSNIVWLEHDCSLVSNEYLYYFYLSKPWIISNGATIPRLYNGDIESLLLPLPPLTVQRAIVSRLDAARKRADGIATLARQAAEASANLRKALLKEAFE